ncbi:MAG: lipid A export permease/ATP-binding protein MsbA [Cellvibrionaceae bacterium]|nr:lipid A export permease/ATP-binding protein MsbA [Cellvibrionaceae bacterium]
MTDHSASESGQKASGAQTYRRLLSYLLPHKFMLTMGLIGFAIFAASQPALTKLFGILVDSINGGDSDYKIMIPLAVVGIFFVRGVGTFIGSYALSKVSLGIVHNLRVQLFDQLTLAPGEYFDSNNSGHLVSRITYNVTQVTDACTEAIKVLIREGLTVIVLLGYLIWEDWKLTLVFVAIAPILGFIVSKVGKRLRRLSSNIQLTMGDVTQSASEMINGYKVMRSFGGEDYERGRFEKASVANFKQNLKLVTTAAINTPVLQLIVAVALGVLMYIALSFMGSSTPGDFIAYLGAAALIPKPVRQLSEVNSKIQKGIAAAEDIFAQLDVEPEPDYGSHTSERVAGNIAIKDLNFAYNASEGNVLKNINLDINAGQTVALVGRSGSGKTTLASLIPRFYHHEQGSICIDDVPLNDYQLASLRQQIALVNQDVTLFNDSLRNNIAYGGLADVGEEKLRQAAEAAHCCEFIDQFSDGFDTLVGEDGTRLSGGQRQRIALARALLKDAPILILDEATSALDTESERKIQAALDRLMENRTTIVIAHRLSTIENADVIVVMEKGEIVEQGSHQELLEKNGAYAKLHAMQFGEESEVE